MFSHKSLLALPPPKKKGPVERADALVSVYDVHFVVVGVVTQVSSSRQFTLGADFVVCGCFLITAPRLRKALPLCLHSLNSVESFKKQLKTLLVQQAFYQIGDLYENLFCFCLYLRMFASVFFDILL